MSAGAPSRIEATATIVGHAWRESLRRRVFGVVLGLTGGFVVLYALGVHFAFREVGELGGGFRIEIDDRALTGATMIGLAMFAILFLGAILGTFLTLGVVRGDAETGLIQPLAARPVGRGTILLARFGGAAAVSAAYVAAIFAVCVLITWIAGDWSPDQPFAAAVLLAGAVAVLTALSVLVSVFTSTTAQGITVLMVFGAGLTAGLLGQIGDALDSSTLIDISEYVSWVLPFEALYQDGLFALTAETSGVTGFLLSLGPFGGARDSGPLLVAYSLAYVVGVVAIAAHLFRQRDL